MKYISFTTTLPFFAAIALSGIMQDTLVHGFDQKQSVIGSRNLKTDKASKTSKSSKTSKASKATKVPKAFKVTSSTNRVQTMWWIIFNKPSECNGGSSNSDEPACGLSDVMGNAGNGTNKPQIAIINASGGIPDENGFLRMVSSIYSTQCDNDIVSSSDNGHYLWGGPPPLYEPRGSSFGLCPADGEESEVHIVIRDHGPPTDDQMWQLTRFTDPSCSDSGGPNLCVDTGVVGFSILNDDVAVNKSLGGFPVYPVGCFEAGTCTEEEEAIQLRSGSEVTLIRTGDAYQVIAEINVSSN